MRIKPIISLQLFGLYRMEKPLFNSDRSDDYEGGTGGDGNQNWRCRKLEISRTNEKNLLKIY